MKISAETPVSRGGEGDGGAEVPAGGGDHAGRWHLTREQLVERASRLERPRVLHELELGHDRRAAQLTELEHGRSTDPTGDPLGGGADVLAPDGHGVASNHSHRLSGR